MTSTQDLRIDAQVELGCLFGMVHASVVGDSFGAHVEIDGNVISDFGLFPLRGSGLVEVAREVRRAALIAVERAHREIALDFGDVELLATQAVVARALLLGALLEEEILAEAAALVALLGS